MALEAERHLPTYLQRDRVDRPEHLGRAQHRQPDYATNPTGGLAAGAVARAGLISERDRHTAVVQQLTTTSTARCWLGEG